MLGKCFNLSELSAIWMPLFISRKVSKKDLILRDIIEFFDETRWV